MQRRNGTVFKAISAPGVNLVNVHLEFQPQIHNRCANQKQFFIDGKGPMANQK
jgi:hypothetical protein